MDVTIPDTVSESEALTSLTASLADALGIDEENINLSIDAETGEITYTIGTPDYESASEIQSELEVPSLVNLLNVAGVVTVDSVEPNNDIIADITVVVDADELTVPLQQAENTIDALLDDTYSSETTSSFN